MDDFDVWDHCLVDKNHNMTLQALVHTSSAADLIAHEDWDKIAHVDGTLATVVLSNDTQALFALELDSFDSIGIDK